MQLIEVSMTGVRSAVVTLRRPGSPLSVVLFPMVHLGTPAFYQAVTDRLATCDVIVAEGVGAGSTFASALTLAYRLPARSRQLGLVVQDTDLSVAAGAGAEIIQADLTAGQLRLGLRGVPRLHRLAVYLLVPAIALAFMFLGTRAVLARYLSVDDVPLAPPADPAAVMPALSRLVLDDRDQLLVAKLTSVIENRGETPGTVAVVYGAAHMLAVVRSLAELGYRPRQAEWLTVFDLDP